MTWRTDIDAAPHGKTVSKTIVIGVNEDGTDKVREV